MRKPLLATLVCLFGIAGLARAEVPAATPADQSAAIVTTSLVAAPEAAAASPVAPCPAAHALSTGCPDGRIWVSAEYLLWWIKDAHSPPLVTSGPTGVAVPGAVGSPDTIFLFGGSNFDYGALSGFRFGIGAWLDDSACTGIEANYFRFFSRSIEFAATSPGAPLLARPFFDILTGLQNSELVAFPGLDSGTVKASSNMRLEGAEVNLLQNVYSGGEARWYGLAGIRYLQLREKLDVVEDVNVAAAAGVAPGANIFVGDGFHTWNNFYGAQLGVRGERRWGSWTASITAKAALGISHQTLDVFGTTVITAPGGAQAVFPAGLLALGSNSGRFRHDEFAFVPELTLSLSYQVTEQLRAFIGYNFMYWTDVIRPGDQIDFALNGTQIPTDLRFGPLVGPAHPFRLFKDSDFWASGVNFGLEFRR